MNRKEMKQLLEERFDRIALLETRIDTMEQLIDGYHAREQSLIDTLHTAQSTAKRLVEGARTEAETIREQARREGESLLEEKMQAAQAFDDFFSGSFEPAGKTAQDEVAPEQATGPEGAAPYSEQAWAQDSFLSNHEPQAEGALAFDALFGETQPAGTEPVSYEGVSIEQTASPSIMPPETTVAPAEDSPTPEPYSEQAWAQGAFLSNHEPQAEGALAFDTLFGENDSNGASESSYEPEEDSREWEPEHEPEADEIPTVSQLVSRGDEEEVSLDALLEEIIRAGE